MKKGNQLVLLYEIEGKQREQTLKLICVKLGIRIKVVPKEDYLETIGYIAKIKGCTSVETVYEGEKLGEEMMVLVGFSSAKIDELLLEIRKAQIGKIQLKAVLTEYNKDWNSIQLHEELKKEHEAMRA